MKDALISTNDTVYIGEKTLEKLFDQQQTINNIEKNINNIENNINISNIVLEKMEYLSNRLKSWIFFSKPNNFKEKHVHINYNNKNFINNTKNISETKYDNTNQVINNLKIIKEINMNINKELENQLEKLDNIGNRFDNNNIRVNNLNNRINKIL